MVQALCVLAMVGAAATSYTLVVRRRSKWRLVGLFVAILLAAVVLGLFAAFTSVAAPDASSRATALARGISEAMNCAAIATIAGMIGGTVALVVRRARR